MLGEIEQVLRAHGRSTTSPLVTENSFETFDDDGFDSDEIAAVGDWAHKVTVGQRSQSTSKMVNMIANQQKLKTCMAANPNVAQLPVERKKRSTNIKLVAKSVELEERETLVLMDNGSARMRKTMD